MESQSDSRHYEFDGSQNSLIKDLSGKMRFVSYFFMVFGILGVLEGLLKLFGGEVSSNIVNGVASFAIGLWTGKAASSFKLIVDTEGNDIEHLIGALGQLRKLYALQYWVLVIGIIFTLIVIITALLMTGAASS